MPEISTTAVGAITARKSVARIGRARATESCVITTIPTAIMTNTRGWPTQEMIRANCRADPESDSFSPHSCAAKLGVYVCGTGGDFCLDVGHKSISAENELNKRIYFLNAPELTFIGQSEEHLVVDAGKDHHYKIGDVLYGLPYHICPTIALYERAITIENNQISGEWRNIARDRKISI